MQIKKLKSIIAGIILLLFILFNYCNFLNLHLHVLGNGYFLVHAHPYEKNQNNNSPVQTHQHSNLEFLILNLFTIIEFIIILLGINILFEKLIIYFKRFEESIIPVTSFYAFPALRGPPFC